jgi:nucleoid-associated protein YgaU
MRVVAKVLLVLSVVGLVFIVLVVVGLWGNGPKGNAAGPSRFSLPSDQRRPGAAEAERPYNDPITRFQHLRDQPPSEADRNARGAGHPPKSDLRSTSEKEGDARLRLSDEPVFGADPPGPTLRPEGAKGTVVTEGWKPKSGPPDSGNVHVVQQGDTLYGIAVQHYGDAKYVPMIEAANPGLSARALQVGHRLTLPGVEPMPAPAPGEAKGGAAAGPGAAPADPGKVYLVRKGDTLVTIARRFYGDASTYRSIYELNRDTLASPGATLYVGQHLRMPDKP